MTTLLSDLLLEIDAALAAGAAPALPVAEGCSPRALPRLVWALREPPPAGPLVEVEVALADARALADAARQARGGWLVHLGPAAAGPPPTLRVDPDRRVQLSEGDRLRLQRADALHPVAADPALAPLRRALLAHCHPGAAVHLTGPPGTGKRALATWAHAAAASAALRVITGRDGSRPAPADWALFEELPELGPEAWT